jgi:DNA-binding NtrC family response regulator
VKPRILVVDNDPEMVSVLQRHLESEGWEVTSATRGADALHVLAEHEVDVLVTDVVMDDRSGLDVLKEAQRLRPRCRVILMTAFATLENAIEAIRHGAHDYLTKPFKMVEVSLAIRRALDDRELRDENRRLRQEVRKEYSFDNLIGRSPAVQAVFAQIRDVSASDAAVLLLGESGTGKELVARAVHWNSGRRDRPFVAVNCAALPEGLLESELFGHERGAFTGATQKRGGLLLEAHGGTLFLDEIGDMPLALQAKLLRVLQDKTVRAVGGREEVRVDFRLISATNRDLGVLFREGKFREDLYYRLAVIPIRVPALRERPDDIPLLARHFLARAAGALSKRLDDFDEPAMSWLIGHRWPGNVRELENVVERAATLARGPLVTLQDLRIEFAGLAGPDRGLRPTLEELERSYIERVLEETRGDKRAAARILGLSVRTLQRRFPGPADSRTPD